ncbi:uncharacterized protein LOC127122001 [Lathyrus oleraceus]|uniref:uncharacterized protein LOC127122001 n=1 Tax=Pisum sativum TaxID=3888 RepID=UPI0021D013C4|nr:uncharacterized protein LOC127122001 [Pisum sativum]
MDFGRKSTQKYTFRTPKLEDLKKLASLVTSTENFQDLYGKLLSILGIEMEDGLLNTLVQFYDSMYHCFTFLDCHLMPTLEEYSYLVGLSISNQIPFYGLEEDPKPLDIAKALHLKKFEIEDHMTSKSGIQGIPAKFLIGRAHYFAGIRSVDAFEAIFALLIYGLVLLPNADNFVEINSIKIFLIGNPVPTLLGDTCYFIHHRTSKGGGMIVCGTPFLYKWFISHLPRSSSFWDLNNGLRWSQKIMALTHSDIVRYNRVYDGVMTIDRCDEFLNVPLLGTKGGINYNPVLARRQFWYAMRGKPNNIWLSSFYLKENEDNRAFKEKIIRAWYNIRRKGRE